MNRTLKSSARYSPLVRPRTIGILFLFSFLTLVTGGVYSQAGQAVPSENDPNLGPLSKYEDAVAAPSDPSAQERRAARDRRYYVNTSGWSEEDKRTRLVPKETKQLTSMSLPLSGGRYEQALPVGQCDSIVVGVIADAHAYFPAQHNVVYSEFKVQVQQVLKGTQSISVGNVIDAERHGGRILMPSGQIVVDGTFGHTLPQTAGRYLLFLRQEPEAQDFLIVTGYELRNGKVFPMDGNEANHPLPQFETYRGMTESEFLSKITSEIAHPSDIASGAQR